MRVQVGRGKQHILRLDIHMDNTIPSLLVRSRSRSIGAITAETKRIRHGMEDVPEKGFREDEAISFQL